MSDMATMAMPVSIDGPLPLAPPYGLIPTVEVVNDPDIHWVNGAQVWGYPPGIPSSIGGCATGTYAVKDIAAGAINPTFGAITTYLAFECTKRSFRSYDELKARLLLAFDASDSRSVEYEFANGIVNPLSPYLGDPDAVLPNGSTAVSPAEGLAILEDYIGEETGRQGVIHSTPGTIVAWTNTLINPVGGKLRTINGNLVVSGGGYIGSQPSDGSAPSGLDQAWVYATGPVQIRRSEPFIPQEQIEQALDRSDNTVVLYAERYYLVDWDAQLHAAVLIDRSIT
jgi:hypothetical protein